VTQRARQLLSAVVALALLAGALWLGRAEVAWAMTLAQDTSEAYRSYAEAWPASRHLTEARSRQDERAWQRASAGN